MSTRDQHKSRLVIEQSISQQQIYTATNAFVLTEPSNLQAVMSH